MLVNRGAVKPGFLSGLAQSEWVKSITKEFTYIHPNRLKEKDLLFKIETAASLGKLVTGISDVWTAANQQTGKLLIAEKDYLFPDVHKRLSKPVILNTQKHEVMSISDAVDNTLESALNGGCNVEFVENGRLRKYKRIVMIQRD
jgi:hypothetical protein